MPGDRISGERWRDRNWRPDVPEPNKSWPALSADRRAVTMLEYAIMAAVIAPMLLLAVQPMTAAVSFLLTSTAAEMP
jgi:Flp pilus assembly pilin Flp